MIGCLFRVIVDVVTDPPLEPPHPIADVTNARSKPHAVEPVEHAAAPSRDAGPASADRSGTERRVSPGHDRPATLPDGSAWPRVAVFVTGPADVPSDALAASLLSVSEQGYPEAEAVRVADDGSSPPGPLARAVRDNGAAFAVVLRAGDRLAPGALPALTLEAWMSGADAVFGLRLSHDDRGIVLVDALAIRPGPLVESEAVAAAESSSAPGGDVLLSGRAIAKAGGISPIARDPVAELWPRLARSGIEVARIGRPVLLRRRSGALPDALDAGLRIAALDDAGPTGGAGIAHRRLVDALRLAGHDVAIHRLRDESPAVAAEWTDAFPATEGAILAGAPDLLLVGNLHGATRTSGVLERLRPHVPILAVLHDLFALTGRCAHPGPCRLIDTGCTAACPTSTLYPQLAPARIASSFDRKRALLAGAGSVMLLANSAWTERRARTLAPAAAVARIDLAFPTEVFRPGDKAALRRRLGLPEGDLLILFGAVIADQPDKGGPDLVRALLRVAGPEIGFVALGRIDDRRAFPLPNLFAPGPIGAEEELAAWYGACDLHVTASRLETLGQTAIEAGLCGVPTVAYRNTGLTTAVIGGVSGVLVDPDPAALADAIAALLADPTRREALSRWGRIALESRNGHAAAALGLTDVLADLGLRPTASERGRVRLDPVMFAAAAPVPPVARAAVAPSRPLVRFARRWKHRIWGRAQPLWMRRALYAAERLRRLARAR